MNRLKINTSSTSVVVKVAESGIFVLRDDNNTAAMTSTLPGRVKCEASSACRFQACYRNLKGRVGVLGKAVQMARGGEEGRGGGEEGRAVLAQTHRNCLRVCVCVFAQTNTT